MYNGSNLYTKISLISKKSNTIEIKFSRLFGDFVIKHDDIILSYLIRYTKLSL